jgi:hypothetical protein
MGATPIPARPRRQRVKQTAVADVGEWTPSGLDIHLFDAVLKNVLS